MLGTQNRVLVMVLPINGSFRVAGTIIEEDCLTTPDPNREERGTFDETIRMDTASFGVNQLIHEVMFNSNRSARVTVTYEVFQ